MIHETNVFVIYEGDGENKTFGWPYPYTDVETLGLYLLNDHVKTIIRENFSFDPETDEFTYPIDGDPIPVGTQLLIARKTEISQLFDLPEYFPFKSEEKAHDKSIMIAQEHEEMLARSLKFEMGINADPTLPVPKPNAGIAWDEEGKKLVEIPDLRNATVEAMRSAEIAMDAAQRTDHTRKQTEDIGIAVAQNIQNLKTDALTSIDTAKENALHEVETSTDIAKSWALQAQTSESNAKVSETNAKGSADKAEEISQRIGNPVASVTEEQGKVTVTKADGAKNQFNAGLNILVRNKSYKVGDLAWSPSLPSWAYLECIEEGTTGNVEPDFSDVVEGDDSTFDEFGQSVAEYIAKCEEQVSLTSGVIPGGKIWLE